MNNVVLNENDNQQYTQPHDFQLIFENNDEQPIKLQNNIVTENKLINKLNTELKNILIHSTEDKPSVNFSLNHDKQLKGELHSSHEKYFPSSHSISILDTTHNIFTHKSNLKHHNDNVMDNINENIFNYEIQSNTPISMSPNSYSPSISDDDDDDDIQPGNLYIPPSLQNENHHLLEDKNIIIHNNYDHDCERDNENDLHDYDYDNKRENDIDDCLDLSKNSSLVLNSSSHNKTYKKLSYRDVEVIISKYYDLDNNNFSNEFNLIITYLKGQKNLYAQSKNLNQYFLNFIDFLIIVLTAVTAVFSPFIFNYHWSVFVFCSVNSLITILYSLMKYFKYETSINTYLLLSNQYDKLQISFELTSNKLFFIKKEKDKNKIIIEKINFIENKINELKDTYPILIPNFIKHIFPVISHVNIFIFIKKVQNYKTTLIVNLKNVKNEIRYIYHKWGFQLSNSSSVEHIRIKKRLEFLLKIKENIKNEIISYKNAYNHIDQIFADEIKHSEYFYNWVLFFFNCKKYNHKTDFSNPVIKDCLKHIIY